MCQNFFLFHFVFQALGSWLYILLDNFGDRQIINDSLIEIQTVLLDCLAENNGDEIYFDSYSDFKNTSF